MITFESDGVPGSQGPFLKRASALRRLPVSEAVRYVEIAGLEGFACAFELAGDGGPIVLESTSGRAMTLVPGDYFLATPGHRESTRWVAGGVPAGGLLPGEAYWVLADSGVIGDLVADSPLQKRHLGKVKYLGAVLDEDGEILKLADFMAEVAGPTAAHAGGVHLVLGTSAEVGKTTAGLGVLRALRRQGYTTATLKATGTSSLTEILRYQDFGAVSVFDCVDFGLPTTYPSGRADIDLVFARALDVVLSTAVDSVLIECGGDIHGANVPVFLECLKRRRSDVRVVLAAADAVGALGSKHVLEDMGLSINLITGPCTDTPTLQQRTQALCGIPALNLSRGANHDLIRA